MTSLHTSDTRGALNILYSKAKVSLSSRYYERERNMSWLPVLVTVVVNQSLNTDVSSNEEKNVSLINQYGTCFVQFFMQEWSQWEDSYGSGLE